MSLAAGRINPSAIVKGFLALAIRLAAKNDALSADTFDEVVAFNNCFSVKTPKAWLLMQGAWSPCGEAVLKVLGLRWIAGHYILCKAGLENVNHLLQ